MLSCNKPTADAVFVKLNITDPSIPRSSAASSFWIGINSNTEWVVSIEQNGEEWASLMQPSGTGNGMIMCNYDCNEGDDPRTMTIVITAKSGTSVDRCAITQYGQRLPSRPQWLELPSGHEELTFSSWSFDYMSSRIRNYSLGYDERTRAAMWVAYPLNNFYKSGTASNSGRLWEFDEHIPSSSQPDLQYSYGGYYDRGHQCPAGDRHCCQDALDQTYKCSNSTPQRNSFNTGVWVGLENRVRSWASKCDTLYVVTGCIMDGSLYTTDWKRNICPVPGHYFKALLAKRTAGWCAAAFLLEHSADYDDFKGYSEVSCTISELESKTGLDFFPLLKDIVGEMAYISIETEDPARNSFWDL